MSDNRQKGPGDRKTPGRGGDNRPAGARPEGKKKTPARDGREMTPEERQAMRRRRALARKKAQQKRIFMFGCGAVLVLILVLILVVVSVFRKKPADETKSGTAAAESQVTAGEETTSGESQEGTPAEVTPTVAATPTPTPTPEPVSILVTATGDVTLGKDENSDYSTSMVAKYEEVGNFDYFFDNVRDIFEADDLTMVNFEGTLTYSEDRADRTYAFKADPSYVQILSGSSVEAANLANNHYQDYGYDSYTDTIGYLEEAGIATFGNDRYAILDVKGVKVAMIGFVEIFDGMDTQYPLLEMLEKVKAEDPDLIIVHLHWGNELEKEPTDIQKALGRLAIDNGADLVIGHHPHVIQGIEKYNGKYICYSVGNFCFGGNAHPTDPDCMIVQQRFTFQGDELVESGDIVTIPCRVSSSYSINNYQPMVLEGDEKERVQNKIDERTALLG